MGKVGAGVRRVAAWALVTGAAVGAVGSLAGCMEVGPAVAPVGAGGPTVGPGEVDGSQDGVGAHHAGARHHPGDPLGRGSGAPSPGGSAARPSAEATAVVPVPVATTPEATPSQGGAGRTTPPAQPSSAPTAQPSASATTVTPPPSPSPTVATPSASSSAG
ncbi:hypothetical protein [Streptacidiphilus jiangxiensis]|uniref:hypothetical protein n=1 Tax=Streptacidiphilus jiangxiensis TaxID=235985 RepID=UPI0006941B6E|nr:hypothetical protein [Streptacidiphilus jiangxiensis]